MGFQKTIDFRITPGGSQSPYCSREPGCLPQRGIPERALGDERIRGSYARGNARPNLRNRIFDRKHPREFIHHIGNLRASISMLRAVTMFGQNFQKRSRYEETPFRGRGLSRAGFEWRRQIFSCIYPGVELPGIERVVGRFRSGAAWQRDKVAEIGHGSALVPGFFLTSFGHACYRSCNLWFNNSVLEYASFKEG